jgi:hypothetical protein
MKFSKINFSIGAVIGFLFSCLIYLRHVGIASKISNYNEAILFVGLLTVVIAVISGFATAGMLNWNFYDGDIALFLITPIIAFIIFFLMMYFVGAFD